MINFIRSIAVNTYTDSIYYVNVPHNNKVHYQYKIKEKINEQTLLYTDLLN